MRPAIDRAAVGAPGFNARSFLMDRATLEAHGSLWVQEPLDKHYSSDISRLTSEERALFEDLRGGKYGERVRLEQERIRYGWLEAALRSAVVP